jgi:hypothetical protein
MNGGSTPVNIYLPAYRLWYHSAETPMGGVLLQCEASSIPYDVALKLVGRSPRLGGDQEPRIYLAGTRVPAEGVEGVGTPRSAAPITPTVTPAVGTGTMARLAAEAIVLFNAALPELRTKGIDTTASGVCFIPTERRRDYVLMEAALLLAYAGALPDTGRE